MKRLMGNIKRRGSEEKIAKTSNNPELPQGDSPEAVVVREVTAFCESGGPGSPNAGEEYLHLPAIVDAAESSPAAAKQAALTIRRYLSKDNYSKGYAQYNAIMLTRILTDNPAKVFTQNFDSKFVTTVKELLRDGKDMSVQQILRETLDYLEMEKHKDNSTLTLLVEMWAKEKSKKNGYGSPATVGPRTMRAPPFNPNQQNPNFYGHSQRHRGLPPPAELASRIEEAKTTARLLLQTIQSTPSAELPMNELVREFADRAKSAQRSMQGFMNSDNPQPDEDTMLTLIETSDQLNIAMSKHQRALLQARKAIGSTPSPQPPGGENIHQQAANPNLQQQPGFGSQQQQPSFINQQQYLQQNNTYIPPSGPPPSALGAVRSNNYAYPPTLSPTKAAPPAVPPRSHERTASAEYGVSENPFEDPYDSTLPPQIPAPQRQSYSLFDRTQTSDEEQQQQPQQQPAPALQQPSEPTSASDSKGGSRDGTRPPPGPYNEGYQPTQSYMQRQESSAEHHTMHGGASPPGSRGGADAPEVSNVNGVERRLGDMRI